MKQETVDLLKKAQRAIRNAESTIDDGDFDFAASRIYYAMFYIASALLGEKDLYLANMAVYMEHLRNIT